MCVQPCAHGAQQTNPQYYSLVVSFCTITLLSLLAFFARIDCALGAAEVGHGLLC